jgi:hypothetical protein
MYSTPQKMKPKNESKSGLTNNKRSEKNGIIPAMKKAPIQVAARMPAQAL